MRLIVIAICVIIVGCSTPTPENRCCTDGTCALSFAPEKVECLIRFIKLLEKDMEITKLKMQYECKETK